MPALGQIQGGEQLDKFLRQARKAHGLTATKIGFFADAKYPDGTLVAAVAAWQEFGTQNKDGTVRIPERPFFRNAVNDPETAAALISILRSNIDPWTMVVDPQIGDKLGATMQGRIQRSITTLKEPPLAESTKKARRRKFGSKGLAANPLIDTGTLRNSVTWKHAHTKADAEN